MDIVIIGTLITIIGGIFAISNNFLNLRDRLKKKKPNKKVKQVLEFPKKDDFVENDPDFKFYLGHISNSPPGICKLTSSFVNLSSKTKFIEPISYEFEYKENKQKFESGCQIMNGEVWPKRLEHGQRFYISVDFDSILNNLLFKYWKKGVVVYGKCHSSTGDYLRSNSIEFDELVKCLKPLRDDYSRLARELAQKSNESLRDLEATLWQLQLFNRITSGVVQQLQQNNIPVLKFLHINHGIKIQDTNWNKIYRDLEAKKIAPSELVDFLRNVKG